MSRYRRSRGCLPEPSIYKLYGSPELASPEVVRQYAEDLRQFLKSSPLPEKKAFIKSFVRGIKVTGNEGHITYTFPIPPDNLDEEGLGVLPTVRYGGR